MKKGQLLGLLYIGVGISGGIGAVTDRSLLISVIAVFLSLFGLWWLYYVDSLPETVR